MNCTINTVNVYLFGAIPSQTHTQNMIIHGFVMHKPIPISNRLENSRKIITKHNLFHFIPFHSFVVVLVVVIAAVVVVVLAIAAAAAAVVVASFLLIIIY